MRVEHGGLVCVLNGREPGRRLLLRADVDALPVEESADNLSGPKQVVSARHSALTSNMAALTAGPWRP